MERFDRLVSSNLLEAELRAAFVRENLPLTGELFDWMKWMFPDRPLTPELQRVLGNGFVKAPTHGTSPAPSASRATPPTWPS